MTLRTAALTFDAQLRQALLQGDAERLAREAIALQQLRYEDFLAESEFKARVRALSVCAACLDVLERARGASRGVAGTVHAIIGRTGVVDLVDEILSPGGLTNAGAPVIVSSWDHAATPYGDGAQQPPVGRASVHEEDLKLVAEIAYDDTPEGREALRRVLAEQPGFSFALQRLQTAPPTAAERACGAIKRVVRYAIREVSPTMRPAGRRTVLLSACSGACRRLAPFIREIPEETDDGQESAAA